MEETADLLHDLAPRLASVATFACFPMRTMFGDSVWTVIAVELDLKLSMRDTKRAAIAEARQVALTPGFERLAMRGRA